MPTQKNDALRREIDAAAEVLRKGGLILYPTDTVWGIGCDATNEEAVRIPDHEFCQGLLRRVGRPIVSTSANITGEPTPKRLPEIAREIVDGVDYVVNPRFEGRPTGKPSSIIAFTEDGGVKVIRQ